MLCSRYLTQPLKMWRCSIVLKKPELMHAYTSMFVRLRGLMMLRKNKVSIRSETVQGIKIVYVDSYYCTSLFRLKNT